MKNQGFTIIEMVVVIGLVIITGGVVASLFIGQNRIYQSETAELNITGDARSALDDIDNYVRSATRTMSSYSTYTASSQVLILKIQSINGSNQLAPGLYDYVVYYLSSGSLMRQVFPDAGSSRPATTKKLASNVNSLAFTYNNGDYSLVTEVTTDLTLQQNGQQVRSFTLSSKSTLRDY